MRRTFFAILSALALAGPALAGPTLDELEQDASKKRELDKGRKMLESYFKAEAEQKKGGRRAASAAKAQEEAQDEFLTWLAGTRESIGIDLRGQTDIVIDMLDRARIGYLERKYRKGSIEYVKVDDAKGMKRHEYTILVPPSYDPKKGKVPIVVSLHGRVINPRHPAFRNDPFEERSRYAIWNNWYNTPAAEEVLVVAPTTSPDGFKFDEANHYDDLQALYRTLGEALTDYRTDWDRIFLDVQGEAFRVAYEQALVFAGIIVRDRADDRKSPLIPPENFFMFENLNGIPLIYVADSANWDSVGKPMADALTAAYEKEGKPQNFIVIQATRDANGALRGGEDKIKEFVTTHTRVRGRDHFTWRFFAAEQVEPFPLGINGNFNFDVSPAAKKAPLSEKAGKVVFQVGRESVDGKDINRIDIQVTEAEGLNLTLCEPLLNLDLPITLTVNGAPVDPPIDQKMFERDWEFFFDNILGRRFFFLPALNTLSVSFPHKPQFVSPEEAKPEEGKPEGQPAEGQTAGGDAPNEAETQKAAGR